MEEALLLILKGLIVILTVELKKDYLLISFNYYPPYIARLKKIKGAMYEDKGQWSIETEQLCDLEKEFSGELYFKTPRYKITGETPPHIEFPLPNKYELPKLLDGMNPYKYQEFGYQFIRNRLDEFGFCLLSDSVGIGSRL